nr:alpha/beta hydrolase [Puniceicoccus vermicola]
MDYTVSRGNRNQTIYPAPQQQALYTLRWLRQQAENLNLDESKIGVIGFSAGGHLAACTANGFDREDWLLDPDQTLQTIPARPDACILAYAVLNTQGPFAHRGSMHNLLGNGFANSSISEELNWPERIHSKAPDTFIWHTQEDATVPVENAYRMALRLQEKGIPHEAHVFPKGSHGLGICSLDFRRQGAVEQWRALAERWLREIGF